MRAILGTALAFGLACTAGPVSAANPGDEVASARAGLLEFADEFDRAQLAKDAAALERMVADELVFITGSGKRVGKREFIDGWSSPGDVYDPVELTDRIVIPLGDDAWMVTADAVLSGTSDGTRFSSRIRFTDTFRRVGGEWRAVHIQVTRIAA